MNGVIRRSEQLEVLEVDGETVIMNLESLTVTKLNGMGGYIWSLLDRYDTVDAIVSVIESEYGLSRGTVRQDLAAFLHQLVEAGLVDMVENKAS